MQTKKIRRLIREAVASEQATSNLADALDGLALLRGIRLAGAQRAEILKFIQEYVEHAPALLEAIDAAAREAGIAGEVAPIIDAAEQYFLAPFDLIPDHFGLLGLVDDAYVAHSLMQRLSDSYKANTGRTILPSDLTRANQFIRALIGEPQASMLDTAVAGVLGAPQIQQSLGSLLGSGFSMAGPDPVWGYATIDEVVDARLGAMGVI